MGRVLQQGHHERGREHGDSRIAQDVGSEVARDHAVHFGGLTGNERHGGLSFYRDHPPRVNGGPTSRPERMAGSMRGPARPARILARMPVLLAALGALLMSLDSAINIVLPAMAGAFGVEPAAIRWVIICYVLTYALTAFVAGVLADRLGPGPVFTAGSGSAASCSSATRSRPPTVRSCSCERCRAWAVGSSTAPRPRW